MPQRSSRRTIGSWSREEFAREVQRRERQMVEFARARKAKGWPEVVGR